MSADVTQKETPHNLEPFKGTRPPEVVRHIVRLLARQAAQETECSAPALANGERDQSFNLGFGADRDDR